MISSKIETITPEVAARTLQDHNKVNFRVPIPAIVTRYAAAMTNGKWEDNGAAIVFDSAGNLADGQHRLLAVVKSGITIQAVVVRGVKSVLELDTGSSRKLKDHLVRLGCNSNASIVGMVVRYQYQWESHGSIVHLRFGTPVQDLLAVFQSHPHISDVVDFVKASALRVRVAEVSFVIYRAMQKMPNAAHEFLRQLSGAEVPEGSPVLLLLTHFNKTKTTIKNGGEKPTASIAITIRAWNAFVQGNFITRLAWRSSIEAFPEMIFDRDWVSTDVMRKRAP